MNLYLQGIQSRLFSKAYQSLNKTYLKFKEPKIRDSCYEIGYGWLARTRKTNTCSRLSFCGSSKLPLHSLITWTLLHSERLLT